MDTGNRYFLELAYKGTHYHGWQIQPNAITVQEVLDKALFTLLKQPAGSLGCGRTDTGVHARQFFAHFDYENILTPAELRGMVTRLNALLPHDIAVSRILHVHRSAHARFDATSRSYNYFLHFHKDPFRTEYSWLTKNIPDIELMNEGAAIIKKHRDFSCFSKSNTQVFTNNCTIGSAGWTVNNRGMLFEITADRFLRNMVRAIVGTLLEVGYRKIPVEEVTAIIESKNRSNAGSSVPACGLHLTKVIYPYIRPLTASEIDNG